jgi:hypothetical protein
MAADSDARVEIGGAARDHASGADAVHRLFGQRASAADGGVEQGGVAAGADFRRLDVGVEVGFEIVVCGHLGSLAAPFVQPHPSALAVGTIILDAHRDVRAEAR